MARNYVYKAEILGQLNWEFLERKKTIEPFSYT